MEQWFENKVVLVTGGGDGIGRASARLFALRGAKVVVVDVNGDGGTETVELIRNDGGEALFVAGDVTDKAAVKRFVEAAVQHYGQLNCAMNNAGITCSDDEAWDDSAYQRTIDVNLTGVMTSMKYEIPEMLKVGGGVIVNTASTHGFIASVQVPMPAYTASKHGVIGLTRTAALQYAKRNIRVNAVCPGTTMTAILRSSMEYSEEARKLLENFSPMGRIARPEEIAEAAIWLCSDKSSYVTGQTLAVDGGFLAT